MLFKSPAQSIRWLILTQTRCRKRGFFWSCSPASPILHFKCFTSLHINNCQVRYDITLCPFHQLIGCCGQMAVWCSWAVGYSEFMKAPPPLSFSPFILSTELHEVGLLSRPRALFKSRSVGPQAFHRFNLATHGNCST